jgi:hypothetical protein
MRRGGSDLGENGYVREKRVRERKRDRGEIGRVVVCDRGDEGGGV